MKTILPGRRAAAAMLGLTVLFIGLAIIPATAAEPTDIQRRELTIANQARLDRNYEFAEKQYGEFIAKYPGSGLMPEALLGRAVSLYRLNKYDDSLVLLRENMPNAGDYADQFEYWIGENLFSKGELEQADAAFAAMITHYPGSTNVLSAAVAQADTHYQRKNFEKSAALLADPAGTFARAREKAPESEPAIDGLLLLADSLFELKRYPEIEPVLAKLPAGLPTKPAWRRAALAARTMIATGRAAEAQGTMTNVLARAKATEDPEVMAETHALNGAVLEKLGRPAEALAAYESNLKPEVSDKWRTQAVAKVVELAQATGGPAATVEKLTLLSAQGLDAPARDLVQLTTGELRLELFDGLPATERSNGDHYSAAASNHLFGALGNFTNLLANFTNSPYLGRAWLDRGWCNWYLRQWPDAVEAFGEASKRLPPGVEQAKAVFKLGDSFYELRQFNAALTNYGRLVREFGEVPAVKEGLLDQAYYQMIQAAIETTNQAEAEFAVKALLAQFPGNFHAERGLLLVGQFLNDIRQPAQSRAVLENFANRFQDSPLAPERELAIARTFELEDKWSEAAAIYDKWISHYTNHASRASAEFGRAYALYQANDLTNAYAGFTNFVARFPDTPLAPKAFAWLGNYYYSRQDYAQAELHYQQLFSGSHYTNWPVSRLTYEAQIFASRSTLPRQLYNDAKFYLTNLINNVTSCPTNDTDFVSARCCPRDIYAEAFFAYGDVFSADSSLEPNNRFGVALAAFQQVVNDYPESPLVPAALGRSGECSLQLGAFKDATNNFLACMSHPLATVTERSLAEVELGQALEKEAGKRSAEEKGGLLDAARDHYLNVFYGKNLNSKTGELPDNRWVQQACEYAARLAESRKDWDAAAGLYEHLKKMLPMLSDYYEPQIQKLKNRSRSGG